MIPFRNVWCIDFEYRADAGERPHVWCLTAKELHTGRTGRWWRDELLCMSRPPFDIDRNSVVCSYAISAELSCFLQLGWPIPEYLLDLYAEFRWLTNGRQLIFGGSDKAKLEKHKYSMLAAAFILGVPAMNSTRKEEMRDLAITRWEFAPEEQREMLEYNGDDVEITEGILRQLAPMLDWPRALLRGRYGLAVATMEHIGVPIDMPRWNYVRDRLPVIQRQLITHVDAAYGVFHDGHFNDRLFLDYTARRRINWPLTPTGKPMRDKDTLKDMARLHPELNDLKELMATLGKGRLMDLAIGKDGYNRAGLIPFRAVTGRNQPSSGKFIFGPATWLRGFIQAKPGDALAYLDFAAEEIAIAAAFSQDAALIADYLSGDPYIAFAVRAGLVPQDATKASHGAVRDLCKVLFLARNYGQGAAGLAATLGIGLLDAETLIQRHERAYPRLYRWLQGVVDTASLTRWQHSPFGWRRYVGAGFNPRSVRNWPCQTAGSELLWLATSALIADGIRLAAPAHDAIVILSKTHQIVEKVSEAKTIMATMSELVTGGLPIRVDAKIFQSPRRYMDDRGRTMWRRVMGLCRYNPRLVHPPLCILSIRKKEEGRGRKPAQLALELHREEAVAWA
jgi:DNA polymerase-1